MTRFVLAVALATVATVACACLATAQQPIFGEAAAKPEITEPKCTLIFPTNDLTKIVLQKEDGTLVLDALEFNLEMQPGKVPLVTCRLWRGAYRPTTPQIKKWAVTEIKFVDPDTFQKLVDDAVALSDGREVTKPSAEPQGGPDEPPPAIPTPPTVPLNPNAPRPPRP